MLIDSITLASRDDELDLILSGGLSGLGGSSVLPFGVFPDKGITRIGFKPITVFSGSSTTPKTLLLRIIAAKLGCKAPNCGMSAECFDEYLKLCVTKYTDFSRRSDINAVHIAVEQSARYSEQGNSALGLCSEYVLPATVVLLEEPERGLTLEEQLDLARHIEAMAADGEYQIIMTSVSPVFLGIKNALIYDFDEHPTLPRAWHESRLARAHVQFLEKLKEDHKYLKNK